MMVVQLEKSDWERKNDGSRKLHVVYGLGVCVSDKYRLDFEPAGIKRWDRDVPEQ